MKFKKGLIFLFFILAGVILGSLLAQITSDISGLSWLAYGKQIGISASNPMILDLAIIKIAFGFEMGINVAQIICLVLSFFAYNSFGKKI
ncbi:MAG: DUF4321 domain-containing protein [Oscillospiraceae bacterium]